MTEQMQDQLNFGVSSPPTQPKKEDTKQAETEYEEYYAEVEEDGEDEYQEKEEDEDYI